MTEKEKKQLIIIGVGVAVLAFLLLGGNKSSGRKKNKNFSSSSGVFSSSQITEQVNAFNANLKMIANEEIDKSIPGVINDEQALVRNPFEFLVSTEHKKEEIKKDTNVNMPSFTINGIIYDEVPEDSSVVIEGDFYQEGETVNGWLIVSIAEEHVIFQKGDIEYIFYLYEQQ